jgi:hypothetical protein
LSTKKDTPKAKEIVIDGPNLGMAHSGNSWPASAKGIEITIRYFQQLGWQVRAFVPRHYLSAGGKRGVDDHKLLESLCNEGCVVATPSQDHDDHYWIAYALQTGAYVITNDRMKNHAEEHDGGKEEFYSWRDEKVISYMFVGDMFMPNPDFDISDAPAQAAKTGQIKPPTQASQKSRQGGKKVGKQASKSDGGGGKKGKQGGKASAQGGEKISAQSNNRGKTPEAAKIFSKLDEGINQDIIAVRNTIRHVIMQQLDRSPCNLTKLGQIVVDGANKTMRSNYASRKEIMEAAQIPISIAFYQQLTLLLGELVEFGKKGNRITTVQKSEPASRLNQTKSKDESKGKTGGKPSKPHKARKQTHSAKSSSVAKAKPSVKRMTLLRFKDHLGNKRNAQLSCQRAELPKSVDAALDMLCKMKFPADMALIGNEYKKITSSKLTAAFTKPERLVWFLNLRKECPLRDLIADGHIILRKSKQKASEKASLGSTKNPQTKGQSATRKEAVKPLNKVVTFFRSLFGGK